MTTCWRSKPIAWPTPIRAPAQQTRPIWMRQRSGWRVSSALRMSGSLTDLYDHVLAIEADCLAHADPGAGAANPADLDAPALRLESEFRLENVWFAYRSV